MEQQLSELPSAPEQPNSDDRLWIVFSHISMLLGVGIVLPLVIYLVKKDDSPVVAGHAKEALNFHISILIYSAICVATCVGAPLAIGVGIFGMVFAIIAAVKSGEPIPYRYPLTLRFVS
jgi:hypothetical protein